MKSRILASALLLILALPSSSAIAASSEDSRVAALEEKVRTLEQRIASLEAQLHERAETPAAPSNKASWRKLKEGMSQDDVEALLGSPSRVDAFGVFTVWNYGDSTGGRVQFDGKTKKVTSWHEPR